MLFRVFAALLLLKSDPRWVTACSQALIEVGVSLIYPRLETLVSLIEVLELLLAALLLRFRGSGVAAREVRMVDLGQLVVLPLQISLACVLREVHQGEVCCYLRGESEERASPFALLAARASRIFRVRLRILELFPLLRPSSFLFVPPKVELRVIFILGREE